MLKDVRGLLLLVAGANLKSSIVLLIVVWSVVYKPMDFNKIACQAALCHHVMTQARVEPGWTLIRTRQTLLTLFC
jgi:hypothetical protein